MKAPHILGAAAMAAAIACSGVPARSVEAQSAMPHPGDGSAAAVPAGDEGFTWGPAPAVFPAGATMAVLQGDPSVAGAPFTVRLRFPNGYVIPPHWHPTDENVTVIAGNFLVGMGDRYDASKFMPPLRAGAFITAPSRMNHFAMARGATEVQVHAIGPFAMTYANQADTPRPR
ncbi:MAG TPA: cupin domain-containing protein [Gemmatimonadaceae bacterium]